MVAETRRRLGLEGSLPEQFARYLSGVVQLRFDRSFQTGEPIATALQDRLPPSLQLAGTAFVLMMVVSIALGMVTAACMRCSAK